MSEETELARKLTGLIPEKGRATMGHLIVTTERLAFYEQKFAANAAFGLAGLVTDALQKRHEEGGPMLVVELADVVEVANERKMLNKDRMRVRTRDGEYLFNDGYAELGPLIAPR